MAVRLPRSKLPVLLSEALIDEQMFHRDLQKAEGFIDDRRVQDAEEICRSVLTERPDHVMALRLMGEIRLRAKELDEAEKFIAAALELDPMDPKLHNQLGRLHNNRNQLDAAEAEFRHALELDSGFADAYSNLGHVLRRKGFTEAAEQCFRNALSRDPEHGAANLNLGAAYFEKNKPSKAIRLLEQGLKENMVDMAGRYNLALAYHQVGRFDEAVYTYRQVIATGSKDPDAYSNLASALQAMGDLEGAICGFQVALELKPHHGPSLAGLAGLLHLSGHSERALELLLPHLKRATATPSMHIAYAQLLRGMGRKKEALRHVAPLAKAQDLADQDRMAVMFVLGDLLDDMGEYERAFIAYRQGNRLKAASYSHKGREQYVRQLIDTFSRENLTSMAKSGYETETPVFIVGMPRSGTSLVEQIVASHTEVHGSGELRDIGLLAMRLGINDANIQYPRCVLEMTARQLLEYSRLYVSKLENGRTWARRVTDKMWQNFEHLGLIELICPKARVIHCVRHPLDTGLSCYRQSFGTAGPSFAYDLTDIGHYYSQYRRIMEHWRAVSRLRMTEVVYEDLVENLESESRRIVDFLDLQWEEDCLRFFENPRVVRTASHAQVKRPIYNTSIGHWEKYREQLAPLIKSLAEGGALES